MGKDVKLQTNLVRRGSVFYFRARIPAVLVAHYGGKAERVISLRTTDRVEALQRARLKRIEIDQEFHQAHARLVPTAFTELDDTTLARLAVLFHSTLLEGDDYIRATGRLEGDMFDLYGRAMEKFTAEDGQRVARGALENFSPGMEFFLSGHGIKITPGTELYRRAAYAFAKAGKQAGDAIRARHSGEVVATPPCEPIDSILPASATSGDTLDSLVDYWETQGAKQPRSLQEARTAVRRFRALVGDLSAPSIEKGHIVTFKDSLLAEGKSLATVRKHLNLLHAVLETAVNNGKLKTNPAHGVKVPRQRVQQETRQPFSVDELRALFSSGVYTQGIRPKGGSGEAAYWIPLIALWTGARLNEIGQLHTADIKQEGQVWYFHLTDDPESGKRLKTASSRRRIPIHSELIRCGFLRYLKSIKAQRHDRLFPLISSGASRQLTASFSQWFGRYIRGVVGITDTRKVFHSFRHGFKTACRECDISKEHHDRLTGHSSGDVGDSYGGDFPLVPLAEAMRGLTYKGIDLSHLLWIDSTTG